MRCDVFDLGRFYASPLGGVARVMIGRRLHALWPHTDGLDVLGFGYATPWLDHYRSGARRVVAAMPAAQGAEHWPPEGPGQCVLVEETRLPFPEAMFDRILLVHALEEAEGARALLREVWRVLAPEGRLCVVVAARAGLWSLFDNQPFGAGRPWSRGQISRLLADCMFEPTARARALYVPPLSMLAGAADGFEGAGERLLSQFGGVVMVEAIKRLYMDAPKGGRVLLNRAPVRASAPARRDQQSLATPARPAHGSFHIFRGGIADR